jgi:LEA14-like dessication related protein
LGGGIIVRDYQENDCKRKSDMRPILLALVFLFSFGCKDFKEAQVTGVKGFKVTKANTDGIEADVVVGIKNPNSVGFSVYPSEFDVAVAGIRLGKAKLYKRVKIKPGAEKDYTFRLKSSFKDINLMDVSNLLSGKKRGVIELNGDLKAGKFFVKKRFPVNLKEKIDLSSLGY